MFKQLTLIISCLLVSIVLMAQNDPYGLSGKTFALKNVANGKALDANVMQLGNGNGSAVQSFALQSDKTRIPAQQKWKFVPTGTGEKLFYIQSAASKAGKYNYLELRADEVGKDNGTLQMSEFSSKPNQIWFVHRQGDGTYNITSKAHGAYAMSINKDQLNQNHGRIVTYYNRGGIPYMYWNLIEL